MHGPTNATSAALPQRPIVDRPRLTRLLDRSDARIKLLVAPAGYGKTTLAQQWLRDRPHVWYTCTAASADVAGLAAGLFTAVGDRSAISETDFTERLQVSAASPDPAAALADLIVDALGAWPKAVHLVLDDYERLEPAAEADALVQAIARSTELPLMILSRRRPGWVTPRDLINGVAREIVRTDLELTRAEAAKLLDGRHSGVCHTLLATSQGWPAVLSLAWHSDARTLARLLKELPDTLIDYIADEIYSRAPKIVRDAALLLRTLDSWDIQLLTELYGEALASDLWEQMAITGLTCAPSGRAATSTALHPLVRTFLLLPHHELKDGRLEESLTEALLNRRRWHEAFAHSTRAGSGTLAARVLHESMYSLLDQGRLDTLQRWATSPLFESDNATANLCRAEIAARRGAFVTAEALAMAATRNPKADVDTIVRAFLVAGRSAHLMRSDDRAEQHFERARSLARCESLRFEADWGVFVAKTDAPEPEVARALAAIKRSAANHASGQLRLATAIYAMGRARGSMQLALETCELTAPIALEAKDQLAVSAFQHAHSSTLVMNANYREALYLTARAIENARRLRVSFALSHFLVTRVVAQSGVKAFDAARQSLHESLKVNTDSRSKRFVELNASAAEARLELMLGNSERAAELTAPRWPDDADTAMVGELYALHGLALVSLGKPDDGRAMLVRAAAKSTTVEVIALGHAQRLVTCSLDQEPGRDEAAGALLALSHMRMLDTAVLAYRLRPALVPALLACPRTSPIVRALLSNSEDETLIQSEIGSSTIRIARGASPRPFGLTRREREISTYLCDGLSNDQLAECLFLSKSTVKLHLRHIYRKLGVGSRTEAVVRLMQEYRLENPD